MSRALYFSILLTAATISNPSRFHGQEGARGLRGIVVDRVTAAPLSRVEVWTIGGAARAFTDDQGEFILAAPPAGTTTLVFRRLGYRAGSLTIQRAADDTTIVRLAMELIVQELSVVRVDGETDAPPSARLAGFEERRARGVGRFITLQELERRGSMRTSDLLRGVLSIDVRAVAEGGTIVISRRGTKLKPGSGMPVECPIPVLVDGSMRLANLDELLPKDIAGIEVYSGPGTAPLQYQSKGNYLQCGLVLIWTRGGSR